MDRFNLPAIRQFMASIPGAYGYLHLAVKFFPNPAKRCLEKKKKGVKKCHRETRKREKGLGTAPTQVRTNKNTTFIAPTA